MTSLPKKLQAHCVPEGGADLPEEEWLELRTRGIGASDAPKILGMSDHESAVEVWKSKTGRELPSAPWLDPYRYAGHYLEEAILDYVFEPLPDVEPIYGADLPILKSIKHPHLRASLDGYDPVAGTVREIKTDTWDDLSRVPNHHWAQVQHQLCVTGASKGYVHHASIPVDRSNKNNDPVLRTLVEEWVNHGNGDFCRDFLLEFGEVRSHPIDRDDEWIERWVSRSKQWWNRYVEGEIEPPGTEELEGTVDLNDVEELREALDEKSRVDARYNRIAKPIESQRDELKNRCRDIAERYAPLEGDAPKRWQCGPHKATNMGKYGNRYWRLYPADAEEIDSEKPDPDELNL